MRHSKAQVTPIPVLQTEHVVAHYFPTTGFLPHFSGMQSCKQQFLSTDRIHLFTHDLLNFQKRALREEQIIVNARRKLANIPGTQKQLMTDDLRFRGSFTQSRDKKSTPTHSSLIDN